jgi:hypothetical protein
MATYVVTQKDVIFADELVDRKVVPATGSNPFVAGTSSANSTFEVFISPNGDRGFANELKYNVEGACVRARVPGQRLGHFLGKAAIIMLTYHSPVFACCGWSRH